MPKMKTKRSAAKRFEFTGSGKVKFRHAHHRHNLTSRPKKAKALHRKAGYLTAGDAVLARQMLPYGG